MKPITLEEPELGPAAGSEIEAMIDVNVSGSDGVPRPILINQCGEEILILTLEDGRRLLEFLQEAVPWIEEDRRKIAQ